jgi:hypothetical protein
MTSTDEIVPAAITVEFTPDELRVLTNALASFASDFGHDEADVLRTIQQLQAKLEQLGKADR